MARWILFRAIKRVHVAISFDWWQSTVANMIKRNAESWILCGLFSLVLSLFRNIISNIHFVIVSIACFYFSVFCRVFGIYPPLEYSLDIQAFITKLWTLFSGTRFKLAHIYIYYIIHIILLTLYVIQYQSNENNQFQVYILHALPAHRLPSVIILSSLLN